MPMRALTALIVFAALAFGLVAGAHPCSAWEKAPASQAPCHGGRGTDTDGHRDSSKDCGLSCQHACHMTAVAESWAVAFAIAPVALAAVEAPGSELPRLVQPIEHVPLA
jgi:uncharacterized membrane protein